MATATTNQPVYFYGRDKDHGYLSQMFMSAFVVDGVTYPSAEHFFQAAKARQFEDEVRSCLPPKTSVFDLTMLGYIASHTSCSKPL